ncbi:MAG: hypothetical protein E6J78_11120 [Deltaproteobacteria bacterium]|nr:MAG: hypothetical protein E6J78_11120 [Deltaproteobacteria bacterium]
MRAARARGAARAPVRGDPLGGAARAARLAFLRGGRPHLGAAGRGTGLITASFRHIAGIGGLRERQLWFSGVRSWDDVGEGELLSPRLDGKLREGVAQSRERLAAGDVEYFARVLPQTEHWRLLPQVIDGAAFIDIEAAADAITVIGVLDARGIVSLSPAEFLERARGWSALVTFNGAAFDLPILRRALPHWTPPAVHVDLKHVYQRLRDKGGLKEVEKRADFFRPPHLARLSGADAVALWHAQKAGDRRALQRLVEYNLYDVFHLRPLAELGYNRLLQRTGMPARPLPVTDRGAMLYDVTKAVAAALRLR